MSARIIDVNWLKLFPSLANKQDDFLEKQKQQLRDQGVETRADLGNVSRDSLRAHIAALVLDALKPEGNPTSYVCHFGALHTKTTHVYFLELRSNHHNY